MGVHGHQLAIAGHIFYREFLVRKLDVILDHCFLQSRKARGKEWIVVFASQVHMLPVRLIDATCHNELQELNC